MLNESSISYDTLHSLIKERMSNLSLSSRDAKFFADYICEVSFAGIYTHSLMTLKAHINKINSKQFELNNSLSFKKLSSVIYKLDCNNMIGCISATYAIDKAIEISETEGIGVVLANNANTYGAASYYANRAVKKNMIGITFTNSPAAIAPIGGIKPIVGTNPFSVGIPANTMIPFLLDMSSSKVAKSKINIARLNNESIPNDWAIDVEGNPTTNPIEAIKGSILPLAGFKGFNLAILFDILSGLLTGSSYQNNVGKFYGEDRKGSMDVGQVFISINPKILFSGNFYVEMDSYLENLKRQPLKNNAILHYPGEGYYNRLNQNLSSGINIDNEIRKLIINDTA
ncbi:Ldh family oxidoreductase [Streptococcus pluranimalium]|uniref:Ldh family oxidoreductase n=1 Tax=Streptococcus pluranimalium TaxID=82348 RepID=UPI0039FC2EF8